MVLSGGRHTQWKIRGLFTALIVFLFFSFTTQAQAAASKEYLLKAAFIYNFLKFTEWPEGATAPESPVTLCIYGQDPFGSALDPLQQKTVDDRPIRIARLGGRIDRLHTCSVLFVSPSAVEELTPVFSAAQALPVLTISDIDGFARMGGMIGLAENGGKIKFEVSTRTLSAANLKISSKLLELATIVD